MKIKNDLLLKVARGENVQRTPVWLMRQAGRILPEYRSIRNKLSNFKELIKTPELAAEVTIQPVDILGVDAAIIFSDILVVPEAMGLDYQMIDKKGPFFERTIRNSTDLSQLSTDVADSLDYVYEAIKITRKELDGRVPLIGFAGAPWTIFAYMTEGSGSKTFSKAKRLLYHAPKFSHKLLEMITDTTISYLKHQIKSGVNIIQIFDSWAGLLSPDQYDRFAIKYIKKICDSIQEVPVTVFAKGAHYALEKFNTMDCNVVGLDWCISSHFAKKSCPDKTLQGNLDPCALYASFQEIEKMTREMLISFENHPHIANLGHGVYPDTDPEKVKCFIDSVKSYA